MDNPSAFPNPEVRDAMGAGISEGSAGMSLRDWFAGQVLPAVVSATSAGQHHPIKPGSEHDLLSAMATDAYALADAMLKARAIARDGEGV